VSALAGSGRATRTYLAPLLFAVLVAAALLSLAVVLRARRVGVVVDLFQVEHTFTPNAARHTKARIRFRGRRLEDNVTVVVVNSDRDLVRTLERNLTIASRDKLYRFDWNGRTNSGTIAPAGRYRAEIEIPAGDRKIVSPQTIRLKTRGGG
jgi:FlgD Ig-like domain